MAPTTRSKKSILPSEPEPSVPKIPELNPIEAGMPPQLPVLPSPFRTYRIPKKQNPTDGIGDPRPKNLLDGVISASTHGAAQVFHLSQASPSPPVLSRFPQPLLPNQVFRPALPPLLNQQKMQLPHTIQTNYRPLKAKSALPAPSPRIGSSETVDLFLSNPTQQKSPGGTATLVKLSLRSMGGKSWKVVQSTAVPVTSVVPPMGTKKPLPAKNEILAQPARQRFKSVVTPKRRISALKTDAKSQAAKRKRIVAPTGSSSGTSTDADNSSMSTSVDDSRRADSEESSTRSPSPPSPPLPVSSGIGPNFTPIQTAAMAEHFKNDDKAAERYTELKEWAVLEASKLFNNGNLRNQMRTVLTSHLDLVEGDDLSIKDIDAVRALIKSRPADFQLDKFKVLLCQQIIKLRDPNYSVYRKNAGKASESSNSQLVAES